MTASPIFIVGCDRSGTTLLRLMLTQHPQLHVLHETGFLDTLRSNQDCYGDFTQPRQRWFFIRDLQTNEATSETYSFSAFDLTIQEAETALVQVAPTDYAGAARALFAAAAMKKNVLRWGDKTPRYLLDLSWLAQAFPQAQFVHIIRDGRDVASSIHRAGWKPNIQAASQYWRTRVIRGRKAGSKLSPSCYCETQYEELVRNPESTLRSLCDWLDLPFDQKMLNFHEESGAHLPDAHEELYHMTHRPVDPSRAQAWKRTLSSHEVADAEDVAGDLLSELGYELTGARLPLWLRSLRALRKQTATYTRSLRKKMEQLGLE